MAKRIPKWYTDFQAAYKADKKGLAETTGYSVHTLRKWAAGKGYERMPQSVIDLFIDDPLREFPNKDEVEKETERKRKDKEYREYKACQRQLASNLYDYRYSDNDKQDLIDYAVDGGIPLDAVAFCRQPDTGQWELWVARDTNPIDDEDE